MPPLVTYAVLVAVIANALGFTHTLPCAATLFTIFGRLDREAFEAK